MPSKGRCSSIAEHRPGTASLNPVPQAQTQQELLAAINSEAARDNQQFAVMNAALGRLIAWRRGQIHQYRSKAISASLLRRIVGMAAKPRGLPDAQRYCRAAPQRHGYSPPQSTCSAGQFRARKYSQTTPWLIQKRLALVGEESVSGVTGGTATGANQEHQPMRIYIIGNDGITLCREMPAAVSEGEIAIA